MTQPIHAAADAPPRTASRWRLARRRLWLAVDTLKFRVVLVAVMSALLSGVASSYFMAVKSERMILRSFGLQQRDEVELAAEMLSSKISRVQANLLLVASEVNQRLVDNPPLLQKQLYNHPLAVELFTSVQVVTLEGNVIATGSHRVRTYPDVDYAQQPYFQRTASSGMTGMSEPEVNPESPQEASVIVTVPVRHLDGRIFAVMAGKLPLLSADMLPSAASTMGQFAAVLIVYSESGMILSHPDSQRRFQPVASEPGLGEITSQKRDREAGMDDVGTAHELSRYLVATAHVPATNWFVARVTGTDYALQPLRQVHSESWGLVLAIMGVCAVLSALLIANIARPITQLRDRAQQLLGAESDPSAGWPQATGEIGQLVQVFRHVTQQRAKAQAAQMVMVEQLKAILKNASVGIIITRGRTFELVGSQASELFGYAEGELLGLDSAVIYASTQAYVDAGERIRTSLKMLGYFDGEVVMRRKGGNEILVHMRGRNVIDNDPGAGIIWILTDVTAERAIQDQLSWTASHDSLTQLVNRLEFESRLGTAIHQVVNGAERVETCAMFIDLDRFKPINDTAGHAAGDEVLRQIARLLESLVRQTDTVARMGGDEFAILLPRCSLERAGHIAEQVRQGVEQWSMLWRTYTFRISASIGVVKLSSDLPFVAAVLEAADSACYEAKRGGRNRVVTYDVALDAPQPKLMGGG